MIVSIFDWEKMVIVKKKGTAGKCEIFQSKSVGKIREKYEFYANILLL